MHGINTIEGDFTPPAGRFAIIAARFNGFIVDSLIGGAVDALTRHGVDRQAIDLIWVPGSFELPLAAQRLAAGQQYRGIIALGTVIRGATPHFDYVAGECAKGLSKVMMEHDLPVAFGVLTTNTIEQAVERAGTKAGNKGVDAAMTVLEMASLLERLTAR